MVSHRGTETQEEGEKDRGDETGEDGGGELERKGKKAIRVVTIEIDFLHRSELPSLSLSRLLTLFFLPSLSSAAATAVAAAVIRSLYDH